MELPEPEADGGEMVAGKRVAAEIFPLIEQFLIMDYRVNRWVRFLSLVPGQIF